MTTIDRILELQSKGLSDNEVINMLQNEGVSYKEINDSLSQAKIKNAVNQPPVENEMMGYSESVNSSTEQVQEVSQEVPRQEYAPQEYTYTEQPQYAPQGNQGYYQEAAMGTDTISEIVDRMFIEKMKETNQKIKASNDFRLRAENDLLDIKDRLKRIETTIDNLQRSVIGKIGEFGQSSAVIHKDLENLHGTVSKLMNPLIDNYNELKKQNSRK